MDERMDKYLECFDEDGVPDMEKLTEYHWWLREGVRDLPTAAEEIRRRQ